MDLRKYWSGANLRSLWLDPSDLAIRHIRELPVLFSSMPGLITLYTLCLLFGFVSVLAFIRMDDVKRHTLHAYTPRMPFRYIHISGSITRLLFHWLFQLIRYMSRGQMRPQEPTCMLPTRKKCANLWMRLASSICPLGVDIDSDRFWKPHIYFSNRLAFV